MDAKEIHEKIIKVLKEKGPCLPIQISKEIGISSLFVSAFLSELTDEKKIKVSHLKVGGSPLYFIDGQEGKLELYSKYLHPKEAEALIMLKDKKILKDSEQEPAIRVALRSIRDFAIGFKKEDEIYWRYFSVGEEEVKKMFELEKKEEKKEIKKEEKIEKKSEKKPKVTSIKKIREIVKINEFENPLIIEDKKKKEKPKSEFVLRVINFLEKKGFKIIEEKNYKAKEYLCIIQIDSQLGNINFLCSGKDKKKISESDLKKFLSDAQRIPLPALLIYNGEITKTGKVYLEKYNSILKVEKID